MARTPKFGWITPAGVFEEVTGTYQHAYATCLEEVWESTGLRAEVDAAEQACNDLLEAGEHPEWHSYEICQDNANREVCREAVKLGFVRVGVREGVAIRGTAEKTPGVAHFEFAPNKFTFSLKQACEDWAEGHRLQVKWEPAKWV